MGDKILGRRNAPFYLTLLFVVSLYLLICLFGWKLTPPCLPEDPLGKWPNTMYRGGRCLSKRHAVLLGMNKLECEFGRRVIFSIVLGLIVGYERRSPDRPAGLKLMSSVSLGACCFTITSMFAFQTGYMAWDAARVAAAIPSGVGFVGAGVICKGFVNRNHAQVHEVHGLTTAASIWLSSALGVLGGGGLYFPALFAVGCAVALMRFGPRNPPAAEYNEMEEEDSDSGTDTDVKVNGSFCPPPLTIETNVVDRESLTVIAGPLSATHSTPRTVPQTPHRDRESDLGVSPAGLRQRPPAAFLRQDT